MVMELIPRMNELCFCMISQIFFKVFRKGKDVSQRHDQPKIYVFQELDVADAVPLIVCVPCGLSRM